ncbi:2-oxo acid dehydrogenase subunit E2 [bacterium]|nr:2-oxo acid dehydrogenase subunit E2 [bacterium]
MVTVTMPQLGESITEGTVLHWLKQPGDAVALDDALCEIETEKVTAELPSPYAGTMGQQFVAEGEVAQVGEPLCDLAETGASQPSASRPQPVTAAPANVSTGRPASPPSAPDVAQGPGDRNPEPRGRFYSPAVLRLAREHAIDLERITGTGIGGRVRRKDVEQAITMPSLLRQPESEAPPATAPSEGGRPFRVATFSPTRRTIAANMQRSMSEAPQAWTMVEADVTALMAQRSHDRTAFEQRHGGSLTLLPYFVHATCRALREFPSLNGRWTGDELRIYDDLDIGVAVATETGLVVPVVRQADRLSVEGLALAISDVAERARSRRLQLSDIEGGTFTVNNTGAFGSIASKPIVNVPQVAIVTMERAVRRPVALDDSSIGVRWIMNVCLSFDHRAMDGSEAGGFLAALRGFLEQPAG